jgi:hypothetical protein
MSAENMKIKIITLVEQHRGGVSFVELSQQVEGFSGDLALCCGENLVIWPGVSQEAFDALDELRKTRAIHYFPTSVLVYLADGMVPQMPQAKARRKYKTPHWAPAVINPGPPPAR